MSAIPFYKSVYETHFLAGDSGRSRGLDHRAMPGAPVSYRLSNKLYLKCKCVPYYIICPNLIKFQQAVSFLQTFEIFKWPYLKNFSDAHTMFWQSTLDLYM